MGLLGVVASLARRRADEFESHMVQKKVEGSTPSGSTEKMLKFFSENNDRKNIP